MDFFRSLLEVYEVGAGNFEDFRVLSLATAKVKSLPVLTAVFPPFKDLQWPVFS